MLSMANVDLQVKPSTESNERRESASLIFPSNSDEILLPKCHIHLPLAASREPWCTFTLLYPLIYRQNSATMAPVKKSKSAKNSESINSRLQLVVKSGKVGLCFGLNV
jgi:hypothetical protein